MSCEHKLPYLLLAPGSGSLPQARLHERVAMKCIIVVYLMQAGNNRRIHSDVRQQHPQQDQGPAGSTSIANLGILATCLQT